MNRRNPNRFQDNKMRQQTMGQQNNQEYRTSAPNNAAPVRSGSCVLCKASTVLLCQRCGDFYCSPNCQIKDWPKHRYICFPMPQLVHSSQQIPQDLPALNGYKNRELPQHLMTSPDNTQKGVWVNHNSPPPQNQQQQKQSHLQQQQKQQQQQQHLYKQQQPPQPVQPQQNQQRQHQSQQPKPQAEPDKKQDKLKVNIGKIEQAPFPKSNSDVILTAFRSSNRVFLRSNEKADNEGYCEVIKKINEYGSTAGPLKIMPSRNAFAITDFNDDGIFYRVQVVSVKSENEINVIYYDFGNEATKKLSELKEISRECAQLKQYIMLASLKGVPHVPLNEKLKSYLKSFENAEAKIFYSEKEKPACEITLWGVEESVNKKLNFYIQLQREQTSKDLKEDPTGDQKTLKQEFPSSKAEILVGEKQDAPLPKKVIEDVAIMPPKVPAKSRPSQLAKPVMTPPFDIVHMPVGQKNLEIMVVDNSLLMFGYFGCILHEDRLNLQSIQKYLSEYEDNKQPYKPKVEEYCLAQFEQSWYRAKALSILSSDYVEVVFIDFLNETQVNIKSIRRYPMDLDYPCKTSLCMIDDLPSEISDDIVEVLKEKLQPGSEHIINEVKGVEEDGADVLIVKMNQVSKWIAAKAT